MAATYSPNVSRDILLKEIAGGVTALSGASTGGGTSPGFPAQNATASGANLSQGANVTVGTSSTSIVASNATARVVSVMNVGSVTVALGIGTAAIVGAGIQILAGGLYETPVPITAAVNGIVASGSGTVTPIQFL